MLATQDQPDVRPSTSDLKGSWANDHNDWKETTCSSNVAPHRHVPKDRKGEIRLLREVFSKVDRDHNHELSVDEFGEILQMLDPHIWTDEQVNALFVAADENGNGSLDLRELVHFILGAKEAGDDDSDPEDYLDKNYDSNEEYWSTDSEAEREFEDAEGRKTLTMGGTKSLTMKKKNSLPASSFSGPRKKPRKEEPPTTVEEMYEVLTMRDGHIEGMLTVEDLVEIWMESKVYGLGPMLATLIDQKVRVEGVEPEEIDALELAFLCQLVKDKPEATIEDAKERLDSARKVELNDLIDDTSETKRREHRQKQITENGVDLRLHINVKAFKRVMNILSNLTQIDERHILSVLVWAKQCRFEVTEVMALALVSRVFMKVASGDRSLVDTPISENDFARMCRLMEIIDNTGKAGIENGKVAIFFDNILRNMPILIGERESRRKRHLGKAVKKKESSRKHLRILGRSQLGVLFEELFKALPASRITYGSPVRMALIFLEKADSMELHRSMTCANDNLHFMQSIGNQRSSSHQMSPMSATLSEKESSCPKRQAKKKQTWAPGHAA